MMQVKTNIKRAKLSVQCSKNDHLMIFCNTACPDAIMDGFPPHEIRQLIS